MNHRTSLTLVALILLFGWATAQNVTELEDLCKNSGKPLHISLMSIPTKGHINPLLGVGQQLAKLGCRVSIPIVETKVSWINYEGIEAISVPKRDGESDELADVEERRKISESMGDKNVLWIMWRMLASNTTNPIKSMAQLSVNVARHLLEEHKQGRYDPDIIITERMMYVFLDLAEALGVPAVALNPGLHMGFAQDPVHFVPAFGSNFPLNMSYLQRVLNYFVLPPVMVNVMSLWVDSYVRESREQLGITAKVSSKSLQFDFHGLELVQTCFGLEYPQPVLPTTQFIGPILPLQLKPIPQEILNWIEQNDKDVVYMCMGTVATISHQVAAKFIEAFKGQDYRVLWSLPENQRDVLEGLELPANVRLEGFVPQRETLLLDRVKVFISHTGASSSNEALTSGTPVVCMPFFADQEDYCARIVASGAGLPLDRHNVEIDEIREKVNRALTDPTIVKKANRMKSIMNCGGSLKAADLILKSHSVGIDHLVPHNVHLPWYQKTALDLRITRFVFLVSLPFVLYLTFRCVFCCFRCCCWKSKSSQKPLAKPKQKSS